MPFLFSKEKSYAQLRPEVPKFAKHCRSDIVTDREGTVWTVIEYKLNDAPWPERSLKDRFLDMLYTRIFPCHS